MDKEPFFEFSMENLTPKIAVVLSKFVKGHFNSEEIRKTAEDLKYAKAIKARLVSELKAPSEDLVRTLAAHVYSGSKKKMKGVLLEHFTELTRQAFQELINERVNKQLGETTVPPQQTTGATAPGDRAEKPGVTRPDWVMLALHRKRLLWSINS